MPVFQYKAINNEGQQSFGAIEAASQTVAVESLYSRGEVPVKIEIQTSSLWTRLNQPLQIDKKVSRKEVLNLTQEIARLLEAGIEVERALAILVEGGHSKHVHGLLQRILEKVRDGESLSNTLLAETKVFPLFYIQIIHAGEISGTLEDAFHRLAALLDRQYTFRSSLISALIYPSILLVLIGITLLVVIGVVLPEFEAVFANSGASLPLLTRLVMGFGEGFRSYGLYLLITLVAAFTFFHKRLQDPQARLKFDAWVLRRKIISPLIVKGQLALAFRNLGSMIQNGVPLTDAFQLVASTISNRAIRKDFKLAHINLKEGKSLSQLFSPFPYFPNTSLQLVRVGEETGNLGALLGEAATLLEREVEVGAKRFLNLFSPLMTLFMGAIIAAIIGAVLLGIMSINDLAF